MNPPAVFVIVLNWNGWKDSIPCLESLRKTDYPNMKVVLVDNGSTDESVKKIQESVPEIPILETGNNLGFAGGNNFGIRYALDRGAEYIFILNNDTVVPEDSITKLVNFAEENAEAALIGPEISDVPSGKFLDKPMLHRINLWSILFTKSPVQRLMWDSRIHRSFFYSGTTPYRVYAIHGSAMFFRASALVKTGLFDEETFIYWEEFIVAEKLKRAGLHTYILPSARIWHKGNASISKIGASRFIENVKSEKYFFNRYLKLPFTSRLIVNAIRVTSYCGRCIVQEDYRKNFFRFLRTLLVRDPVND